MFAPGDILVDIVLGMSCMLVDHVLGIVPPSLLVDLVLGIVRLRTLVDHVLGKDLEVC